MKKMMLAFMLILLFQATTATAEASLTLWEPQGNIVCFSSNGKMGIQDLDGAVLCDAIYDYIGYFDEYGLAEIRIGDRKGKIRMDGEVVVPPIHCNSIGFFNINIRDIQRFMMRLCYFQPRKMTNRNMAFTLWMVG